MADNSHNGAARTFIVPLRLTSWSWQIFFLSKSKFIGWGRLLYVWKIVKNEKFNRLITHIMEQPPLAISSHNGVANLLYI